MCVVGDRIELTLLEPDVGRWPAVIEDEFSPDPPTLISGCWFA